MVWWIVGSLVRGWWDNEETSLGHIVSWCAEKRLYTWRRHWAIGALRGIVWHWGKRFDRRRWYAAIPTRSGLGTGGIRVARLGQQLEDRRVVGKIFGRPFRAGVERIGVCGMAEK